MDENDKIWERPIIQVAALVADGARRACGLDKELLPVLCSTLLATPFKSLRNGCICDAASMSHGCGSHPSSEEILG